MSNKKDKGHKKEEIHFEFFGPIGTFCLLFLLPATTFGLYFLCHRDACVTFLPLNIPSLPKDLVLFSWTAVYAVVGWFAFQALLHLIVPGKDYKGVKLDDGTHLMYRCNAFACFMITLLLAFVLVTTKTISPTFGYDYFLSLNTAASIFAFLLAIGLYIASMFNRKTNIASLGNTGHVIYDFFMGRQLNPRTGNFDWKFFCELRPGLIGWVLLNMSMAAKQYELHGHVTNSMLIINVFQFIYVFDALFNEPLILTTMDIATDGFGWMLSYGDLAWVPFVYTLQTRYLVDHPVSMSYTHLFAVLTLQGLGYYIFRASNAEKNAFRTNPNNPALKHLKTLKTKAGTNLLISGWWGMARHINYLGDWLMGLAQCIPTGFDHGITYFFSLYFATLLIHRELRDEDKCKKKYGSDWDEYCKKVPYRIVPYVF